MPTPDAIAALASGWTRADRALVRLSGEGVRELLRTMLIPGPRWPDDPRGPAALVQAPLLALPGGAAVRCLVLTYAAPRSYTGEDAAELVLPGNPALLERVLADLAARPGVREATPGEFSARAFLAGRLTLDQAEGVAATIAAGTEAQLAAAEELLAGHAGSRARAWVDACATLLALVEAGIDFTDQEDVVPIAPAELRRRLADLAAAIDGHLGPDTAREMAGGPPAAVLCGEPNAGKSTLFNALLGRRRSIESPAAGTTRDAIAEPLDLSRDVPGAPGVTLVDLAGLDGSPATPVDRDAQAAAAGAIARADVILWCDPSGRFRDPPPTREGATIIRVRTKADMPQEHARGGVAPAGGGPGGAPIAVCALDGWNLHTLRRAIADAAWAGSSSAHWLLPRHRRALSAAAASLRAALGTVPAAGGHAPPSPELTAVALRSALDALGELSGRMSPDDVIGRVFATFCVGK